MGATSYFEEERFGKVRGSDLGEPDGTEHNVELLEGNRHLILRVKLANSGRPVELLFTSEQAVEFTAAANAILSRIGLELP